MFSTITTEPSTTIPKSMAPRLIRLAASPNSRMPIKANSMEKGMTVATMSAPDISPRSSRRITMTSMPPSARLVERVRVVRLIRSDWS